MFILVRVTVTNTENKKVLTRTFKHARLEMSVDKEARKVKIESFFGNKKEVAAVRTISSHIENLITGVIQVGIHLFWGGAVKFVPLAEVQ